jgi:dTDP-4-dehydrorhamnose 3,5-epimerase
MRFLSILLAGAFVVELERLGDERGFFARVCCAREFAEQGLREIFVQSSVSFNKQKGTLRGMHLQTPPHEEAKLIRCTAGAIYDVIVDLRPDSPTYLKHYGIELSQDNRKMLYVPEGCAHGYQTLTDNAEVFYQMSAYYAPEHSVGYMWNDPAFGIEWPLEVSCISPRDLAWAPFEKALAPQASFSG